ncbi:MAG: WYL domain-containing protein [Bacteriovoracaceae bacterium]|nr:WYL domain-containing protein [Bacteriovoracaceae bacterium]
MNSQLMLEKKRFWEILQYFTSASGATDFNVVCSELTLSEGQLDSFIGFLQGINYGVALKHEHGQKMVIFPLTANKIDTQSALDEWLQFQASSSVVEKLEDIEKQVSERNLFASFESLEPVSFQTPYVIGSDQALQDEMVEFIEEAISDEVCLEITLKATQKFVICPRKVVFLDGTLSLVGEAAQQKCLMNIDIDQIQSVSEGSSEWKTMFSPIEIDDFISSIRAVSETEVRLILKVYGRDKFNSNLKNQHFANQCMFTNPEGDFIWAASIEPSEDIFQWLQELGSDVDILDPVDFKKDFLRYCEAKLKKLA